MTNGNIKGKILKKCEICFKEFSFWPCQKRKMCSMSCATEYKKTLLRDRTSQWKGNNVGKGGLHYRVRKIRGLANKCENREKQILTFPCNSDSQRYEWANVSHKYKIDIYDFMQLCRSCHNRYDYTQEWRDKIGKAHKGKTSYIMTESIRNKISRGLIGNQNAKRYAIQ